MTAVLLAVLVVAAAAATVAHGLHLEDVRLSPQDGLYNPSLVLYRGAAVFVGRTTQLQWDDHGTKWILNRAWLCTADLAQAQAAPRCQPWDPWRGRFRSCRWGGATHHPAWEASGVDDTKLFLWPGRGLWALTGRRPPAPRDAPGAACRQPLVWQQFLVQLAAHGQDLNASAWVALYRTPTGVNWAPPPPGVTATPPLDPSSSSSSSSAAASGQQPARAAVAAAAAAAAAAAPDAPATSREGGSGGVDGAAPVPPDAAAGSGGDDDLQQTQGDASDDAYHLQPGSSKEEQQQQQEEEGAPGSDPPARRRALLAAARAGPPLRRRSRSRALAQAEDGAAPAAAAGAAGPDGAAGGGGPDLDALLGGGVLAPGAGAGAGGTAAGSRDGGAVALAGDSVTEQQLAALQQARRDARLRQQQHQQQQQQQQRQGDAAADDALGAPGGEGGGAAATSGAALPGGAREGPGGGIQYDYGDDDDDDGGSDGDSDSDSGGGDAGAASGAALPDRDDGPGSTSGGESAPLLAGAASRRRRRRPSSWEDYQGRGPVGLTLSDAGTAYRGRRNVMEKNWSPFVDGAGALHVVTRLVPHRVARVSPNGTVATVHETDPGNVVAVLGEAALPHLHGGPPLVLLDPSTLTQQQRDTLGAALTRPGSTSGENAGAAGGVGGGGGAPLAPFYLGVGHYWVPRPIPGQRPGRRYVHFLYRMAAEPPFQMLQVSGELVLQDHPHYRGVSFASGLHWEPASAQLLVSYGSGDWVARLVRVGLADMAALFTQTSTSAGGMTRGDRRDDAQQQQQQQRQEGAPGDAAAASGAAAAAAEAPRAGTALPGEPLSHPPAAAALAAGAAAASSGGVGGGEGALSAAVVDPQGTGGPGGEE